MNRELLKQCLDLITKLDKKGLILESGLIFALRQELAKPEQDRESDRKRFPDEAFNRWLDEGVSDSGHTVWDTIDNIYDAWAAWDCRPHYGKPEQEPFAYCNLENIKWFLNPERGDKSWATQRLSKNPDEDCDTPIYTSPLRKEWVGLTDKEIADFSNWLSCMNLVKAVEAKLKELNK